MASALFNERVNELFDYLVLNPGVTQEEMAAALNVPTSVIRNTIRLLRRVCGEDDTVNLVCEPNGPVNEAWVYTLVGTMDNSEWWLRNRFHDLEARLETAGSVLAAIERGLDGRSAEGRRARIWHRALERAREDIEELA